jgi:ATP adenylyltransferase/5',5'''-P-1,P-4-tetraphosphate phosphorylase II
LINWTSCFSSNDHFYRIAEFKAKQPSTFETRLPRTDRRAIQVTDLTAMDQQELMKRIMEIQKDPKLSDAEKATKRQELMTGKWAVVVNKDGQNGTGTFQQ